MEYGIFLGFGPETFATNISPQRRERVQRNKQNEQLNPSQYRHRADREGQFSADGNVPEPAKQKSAFPHQQTARTAYAWPIAQHRLSSSFAGRIGTIKPPLRRLSVPDYGAVTGTTCKLGHVKLIGSLP